MTKLLEIHSCQHVIAACSVPPLLCPKQSRGGREVTVALERIWFYKYPNKFVDAKHAKHKISTNPMARFNNFERAEVLFRIKVSKFWQGENIFCFVI